MTTLGARLRRLRREHGCTLQDVSNGSGLTPSFLSRLERGIVNISVGNLRKVAAFFGVPITFFFTEELSPRGLVVRAGERLVQERTGRTSGGSPSSRRRPPIFRPRSSRWRPERPARPR